MNEIVLNVLVISTAALLAVSVILALFRIIRGPSILDRMIATDVVLAAIMSGLGGYMALSGRTDLLPVLIVLAMLGFVGSVSVSRYVSKSDSMTPGAEAGALSDFSASDWHMSLESAVVAPVDDAGADDVARGVANVADGPKDVTVRPGVTEPTTESAAEVAPQSSEAAQPSSKDGPEISPEVGDGSPEVEESSLEAEENSTGVGEEKKS